MLILKNYTLYIELATGSNTENICGKKKGDTTHRNKVHWIPVINGTSYNIIHIKNDFQHSLLDGYSVIQRK